MKTKGHLLVKYAFGPHLFIIQGYNFCLKETILHVDFLGICH